MEEIKFIKSKTSIFDTIQSGKSNDIGDLRRNINKLQAEVNDVTLEVNPITTFTKILKILIYLSLSKAKLFLYLKQLLYH